MDREAIQAAVVAYQMAVSSEGIRLRKMARRLRASGQDDLATIVDAVVSSNERQAGLLMVLAFGNDATVLHQPPPEPDDDDP